MLHAIITNHSLYELKLNLNGTYRIQCFIFKDIIRLKIEYKAYYIIHKMKC